MTTKDVENEMIVYITHGELKINECIAFKI